MAVMAAVAAAAMVASTIVQAVQANNVGKEQKQLADMQANQLNQNASEAQAVAQQKEVQQNLKTDYVLSNARASAAASGAGATDPTVTNTMQTIAGQGRLYAMNELYQGDVTASQDRAQAQADIYSGKVAQQAGQTKMYSTILGGASSLFDKFGNVDSTPGAGSTQQPLPWMTQGSSNPSGGYY